MTNHNVKYPQMFQCIRLKHKHSEYHRFWYDCCPAETEWTCKFSLIIKRKYIYICIWLSKNLWSSFMNETYSILCVDDDVDILVLLKSYFEKYNNIVYTAPSGKKKGTNLSLPSPWVNQMNLPFTSTVHITTDGIVLIRTAIAFNFFLSRSI